MSVRALRTSFAASSGSGRCEVLCTDPYVTSDETLLPLQEVVERSDILVISTPHAEYHDLSLTAPVVDIWSCRGEGTIV